MTGPGPRFAANPDPFPLEPRAGQAPVAATPVGTVLPARPEWHQRAACAGVDPGLFFPEFGGTAATRAAKTVCGRCDVRETCLAWALDQDEQHGIFGGHTAGERQNLKR